MYLLSAAIKGVREVVSVSPAISSKLIITKYGSNVLLDHIHCVSCVDSRSVCKRVVAQKEKILRSIFKLLDYVLTLWPR